MRSALLAFVVCFTTVTRADSGDKLATALGQLATAANCSNKASPWRPWCIAATGWATGKPGELPKGKVLLGLTIELEDGKDVAKQLSDAVGMSALVIDADGKVKVTYVTPSNPDEGKTIATAIFNLSSELKGKTASAQVPKDLAGAATSSRSGSDRHRNSMSRRASSRASRSRCAARARATCTSPTRRSPVRRPCSSSERARRSTRRARP
jgi:hypothetical protein